MEFANNKGEVIIYQTEDGLTKLNVQLENESVWLTQEQMTLLFDRDKSTISRHIRNIFSEGELDEKVVVAYFATTSEHGAVEGLTQTHMTAFYNLDVIISVGYRVKSVRGTQFRQWATKRIHEYIVKGFTMDAINRLKEKFGGSALFANEKDDEVVEYAMNHSLSPAMVAEYQLQLPDKKLLQAKMQELFHMLCERYLSDFRKEIAFF